MMILLGRKNHEYMYVRHWLINDPTDSGIATESKPTLGVYVISGADSIGHEGHVPPLLQMTGHWGGAP